MADYTGLASNTDIDKVAGLQSDANLLDTTVNTRLVKDMSPYTPAFDWATIAMTLDTYVSSTDGVETPLVGYNVTDYLPVIEGVRYIETLLPDDQTEIGAWYDSGQVYVSAYGVNNISVAPAGASFLRVNIKTELLDSAMVLVEGAVVTKPYDTIAFLGDSITAGYPGPPELLEEDTYVAVMADKLGLTTVYNYGVSSTHISSGTGVNELDNTFAERFLDMEDEIDALVIYGGVNDFIHEQTAEIGTMADRTNTSLYGGLHVLFNGVSQKYLGKAILFVAPLHTINEHTPNVTTALTLFEYIEIFKEVAVYYGIDFLSLYDDLTMNPSLSGCNYSFYFDGLHPNKYGHRRLANIIINKLLTIA